MQQSECLFEKKKQLVYQVDFDKNAINLLFIEMFWISIIIIITIFYYLKHDSLQ